MEVVARGALERGVKDAPGAVSNPHGVARGAGSIARGTFAIALAWVVLFAAIQPGMRVPSSEALPRVGGAGALDYSAIPRFLTPLSEAYIADVLGNDTASPPVRSPVAPEEPFGTLAPERVAVEHALTNDRSDKAFPIASIPFTGRTDTRAASRDDDPTDCGSVGGTVWYRYTPNRDIGLVAYTFGTDHAVSLGVFVQDDGAWRRVGECDANTNGNALIPFAASEGTTYYFQVTAPVDGGILKFSLDPRGTVTLASRSPTGERGHGETLTMGAPSRDGRYLAFFSRASNLRSEEPPSCLPEPAGAVYGYGTACGHAYVHDRTTGESVLVSTSASGEPGNGETWWGTSLSGNGRFVAFESTSSNLVAGDQPGWDLFVKDLATGAIERIAASEPVASTDWVETYAGTWLPTMSDDGRYVALQTPHALRNDDTNRNWDVYVFDRVTKAFERATVTSDEQQSETTMQRDLQPLCCMGAPTAADLTPYISPTGRFVVFRSPASNLVPDDSNATWDTFVRDRLLGITERVSVSSEEIEGNGPSTDRIFTTPSISADGRFVVFDSLATNLAPEDAAESTDAFLRDRVAGTTIRIGTSARTQAPTPHYPSISRNGRFVTFTNVGVVTGDVPPCIGIFLLGLGGACNLEVYVYDVRTDTTFLVTLSPEGEDYWGFASTVSDDGRVVTFHSYPPDKADHEVGGAQVYVYEAPRPR